MSLNEMVGFKYSNEYLKLYFKEVINQYFPNAQMPSSKSSGSPENVNKHAEIKMRLDNNSLYGTQYYYDKPLKFIHYTTLPSLLGILEDRSIRMSDFNYLNDPLELLLSKEYIKNLSISEELKQNLFCLSMNIYDENNKDTFDMWRFFGHNGRGVGIIITIDDVNRKEWENYFLSSVYYSDEKLKIHSELLKKHQEFNEKNKGKFNVMFENMYYYYYYLLGFHKAGIYQSENEVRLLKVHNDLPYEKEETFHYINSKNKRTTYSKIDIACQENHNKYGIGGTKDHFINITPQIKIERIILGYEFNKEDSFEISDCVNDIAVKNLDYKIEVKISKLREHFYPQE